MCDKQSLPEEETRCLLKCPFSAAEDRLSGNRGVIQGLQHTEKNKRKEVLEKKVRRRTEERWESPRLGNNG